jgi:hypothetical protein
MAVVVHYPIWRPRGLFFCRLLPPLRIQAQNQSSREGSPIGLGLSGGNPTNEPPRGRVSPTRLRTTFNGTPPNLIGVLGGGDLWQKKSPRGRQMGYDDTTQIPHHYPEATHISLTASIQIGIDPAARLGYRFPTTHHFPSCQCRSGGCTCADLVSALTPRHALGWFMTTPPPQSTSSLELRRWDDPENAPFRT